MTIGVIVYLFLGGLVAGFVDSVAGGGGLISVPVLMFSGLPPQVVLGTNKFQASFGSVSAATNYARKGAVDKDGVFLGVGCTFVGAATGAAVIQVLATDFLAAVIPWLLLLVLAYMVLFPKVGDVEARPRLGKKSFYLLFGLTLGFYDGFFGPGTGSFWTAAFLLVLGHAMTRAVGTTKIMNATSNVVSLAVFIAGGNVAWAYGLAMAGGQFIGANLGSNMAMRRGTRFIRPIFITVVLITILRMMWPE
ncbi:MAG: TSUP family transporter [Desulfatibacillaceae bacterium]